MVISVYPCTLLLTHHPLLLKRALHKGSLSILCLIRCFHMRRSSTMSLQMLDTCSNLTNDFTSRLWRICSTMWGTPASVHACIYEGGRVRVELKFNSISYAAAYTFEIPNYKSHIPRSAVIMSNGCSAISGCVGNSKGCGHRR